jgi:hypothetical protein
VTRLKKPRRGNRATKRLDLSDLRALLRDRRVWCAIGKVIDPDGNGQHFELVTNAGGALVDITVEVELQPSLQDVTCRMSGFAGTAGAGIWTVPAVGDEVIVAIPEGEIAFQPTIIGVLSTRNIPNGGGQGPAAARTIIVNGEVLVHDGSGGAVALALKSDVDNLADYITNTLTLPVSGATAGPIAGSPAPSATGTTVLKAS